MTESTLIYILTAISVISVIIAASALAGIRKLAAKEAAGRRDEQAVSAELSAMRQSQEATVQTIQSSFQAFGEGNGSQRLAIFEAIIGQALYSLRQDDARQRAVSSR